VGAWLGRTITAGEDGRPAARVVVLTYGAWQRRFGGDPAILGQSIRMNDVDTTVVGVLPASFEFPLRGGAELYVPLETSKPQEERRYWHWLDLIGRLKPGVTREQAEDDLSALARAAASQAGDWHAAVVEHVVPLRGEMVRGVRPALLVLAAAATVVLLVACANVAALLLVRSATRRRELSIRAAVGADRGRLVRQQLTEAVLLALVGGGGGVLVGRWGLSGLLAAMPLRQRLALPHLRDLAPDTSMLLVALAATLATALLVGLPAAWRAARGDVHGDLKAGGRGSTGSGLGSLTPVLVATETALAVVLLTGAALLVQSFVRLLDVSPGFDPNGLLTMRLALPGDRYRDADALRDFHQRFLDQVRALPGVRDASSIDQLPLTGRGNTGVPTVEGMTLASGEEMPEVNIRTVDAAYFRAMGVPLVRGRGFTSRDAGDAPKVVLVNQTFVDRFFPNGEALGRRLVFSFFEGQPRWEVVGIVGDERFGDLDEPMTPVVYFPYDETPDRAFSLVVRTATDPAALAASIRRETVRLDPGLPVYSVLTMARIVADSSAVFLRRYVLLLVGAFALVALLLSAVGLYGVLARTVAERTQEIGVRLALGAGPGDVVRAVAGRGLAPATAGLLAGLAAALASTRLLGGLLFEIRSNDPGTLVGVALLLFLVASVACWIPARRAARVDPVTALRAE
jgi:putative ABC transport system permease protein